MAKKKILEKQDLLQTVFKAVLQDCLATLLERANL